MMTSISNQRRLTVSLGFVSVSRSRSPFCQDSENEAPTFRGLFGLDSCHLSDKRVSCEVLLFSLSLERHLAVQKESYSCFCSCKFTVMTDIKIYRMCFSCKKKSENEAPCF